VSGKNIPPVYFIYFIFTLKVSSLLNLLYETIASLIHMNESSHFIFTLKVSPLLNLPYKTTVELTFENFAPPTLLAISRICNIDIA